MNLYVIKYLLFLIFEGEKTTRELSQELGRSIYNASHAMGKLFELGLVKHPDNRLRSWVANLSNSTVLLLEKLLLVSKNDKNIKNLLALPSGIYVGAQFYKDKKPVTVHTLTELTGVSRISVMKVLKKMVFLNLLKKGSGKPPLYYLFDTMLSHLFFKSCSEITMVFSKKQTEKKFSVRNIIQNLLNDESVLILVHYGSSIREKDDKFSDIDLFVVTRDRISRGEILTQYSHKKIDISVYSKNGFLELLMTQPDFVANIASGKILKGEDILKAIIE